MTSRVHFLPWTFRVRSASYHGSNPTTGRRPRISPPSDEASCTKWRTRLAILLGLLLPLPLIWLLSFAVYDHGYANPTDASYTQPMRLVPMLTPGERQGLLTYKQECRTDTDCDQPLRCFFNMLVQHSYCADSTCMTEEHCPEGFTCQTWATHNGKDQLRICSVVGVRKEGEVCLMLPREREDGCERGLLCRDRCGRPCRVEDLSTCPEGAFCEDDPSGPSCQPTCEGRTCPEGQRCVSRGGRISTCAQILGQDCQLNACPQGQVCSIHEYPEHAHTVWMDCLQSCDMQGAPTCPEGTVCHLYRCRKSCTPEDSSVCGSGFKCGHRLGEPWTCIPDTTSAREG